MEQQTKTYVGLRIGFGFGHSQFGRIPKQLPPNVKRLFLDFDHLVKIIMMGLGYYKGCIVIGVGGAWYMYWLLSSSRGITEKTESSLKRQADDTSQLNVPTYQGAAVKSEKPFLMSDNTKEQIQVR